MCFYTVLLLHQLLYKQTGKTHGERTRNTSL